jgi:hexulose-6-phosphate isomerase
MIKGISIWSIPGGLEGTLPIDQALKTAAAEGFHGLELGIGGEGVLSITTSQAQCEAIRRQIDASKVKVETVGCGMTWGLSATSDDAATREKSIAAHSAALQRSAWLGCQAMLYVPGIAGCPFVPGEQVRYDVAMQRAKEAVQRLLDTAEKVGVDLCIENVWNGLLLSPLEMRDFVDSFAGSRLGVYFDVGNVLGYHHQPHHWIEILGKRIKRIHLKDFKHNFGWQGNYDFCRLTEGDVPFAKVMSALKAIGYDRTLIAEMLPPAEGLLAHTSAALDRIMRM